MSWINWQQKPKWVMINLDDPDWIEKKWANESSEVLWLQRLHEEREIISETVTRINSTLAQARLVPPDRDEIVELGISNSLALPVDDGTVPVGILDSDAFELGKYKSKGGRPQKRRTMIPKETKLLLVKSRGGICELCKEMVFQQYHHINGDPSNHDPGNLMLLCYECHKRVEHDKTKMKVYK